jgi:hypothetical protein
MDRVDVVAMVDDTVANFSFTGDVQSFQHWDGGRAIIHLDNGHDDKGPVSYVSFRQADMIIWRPQSA